METRATERCWFAYAEAAHYTGLGRTTLTQLVTSGEVRAAKVGKRVLISRDSLDSYLESHSYSEVARPSERPPVTTAAETPRKDSRMDLDATQLYPSSLTCILVIFDTSDRAAARAFHGQRAFWQANADVEALDKDHVALIVKPGGATRGLAK